MTRFACALVVLSLFASQSRGMLPPEKPLVQLAVLLDTSGSMDGLIDQARSQLWTVVNHLAKTKKDGQTPRLEVALYEYGNDGIPRESGWVRQVLPFTDDLDAVSEKLFALKTNGGSEWCGKAIETALNDLKWTDRKDSYRTIFIAGNEPFTQGDVDYRKICEQSAGRGIIINTIHCGAEQAGMSGQWNDGARLGGGKYLCIDQNRAIVAIAAPQDAEITKLSSELNKTYLAYGAKGEMFGARQATLDLAAATQPTAAAAGAPVLRAVSKTSSMYCNSSWDLVDACINEKIIKIEDVKEADLPKEMQSMTLDQRKAHVEAQAKERAEIQKKILALNTDREKFVADKRREQVAAGGDQTLDAAICKTVDEQMK